MVRVPDLLLTPDITVRKKEEVQMKIEPGESNVDGHRIDVNAAD
ncbi:hypothetical protein F441_20842 [Phytophthora nicotianae CJ01A1]|uniref:Uncharacterized protein n=2 Tax=Phytophthora nicotianae TaxID=4792 RepID=W2VW72_PHYNI|nr:hypothetical protein L915_16239 [Phytophthora nicotianae]ETP01978.1 hypothetical protein F441_20842 [Phytophthora nicotianae CJ01A1]